MTDRILPDQDKPIGNFSTEYIRARIAQFTATFGNRHQAVGMVEAQIMASEPRPKLYAVAWWIRQAKVVDAMVAEFGADPDSSLLQDGAFVEIGISKDGHGLTRQDLADMSQDAWDMAWDDFGKAVRRGEHERRVMGCDFAKGKDIIVRTIRDADGDTIAAPLKRGSQGYWLGDQRVSTGAELDLLLEMGRSSGPGPSGFNATWLRVAIHYHGDRAWAYLPTTGLPMRSEVLPTALFRWPTTNDEEV